MNEFNYFSDAPTQGYTPRQTIIQLWKRERIVIGHKTFFRVLRERGVLESNNGIAEQFAELGYFDFQYQVITNGRGKKVGSTWKLHVTEKGIDFLCEILSDYTGEKKNIKTQ